MKRLIITFAVLALSFGAFAQELTILHLNDTHSHIDPERSGKHTGNGGVVEQALYIDEVRAEEGKKNVLLLHAGDFSQGSSYFTELNGDLEIDILNAFKYDAVCLGNHEFDNGIDELARRLANLKVPVVCANYDFSASPLAKYVKPYVIVKKAGLKIGIIGLLTDLSEVVNSDIAAQMKYQHPVDVTNRYAKYLKEEKKCDLVICLTHLGFEDESYTDVMMAPLTRNVDIIVGGHSHTKLKEEARIKNLEGKDVIIVTDWKWGMKVGKLSVEL
jgi:5'-nucleotidase